MIRKPQARNRHRNRHHVDQLRACAPFAECSTRELRLVASFMTQITRPAGTVLLQQGTRGRECFVIVAGQAVVERDGAIVGHAVAGSIVGELALMGESRRTATVTAATDVEILVMSQTEFASIRGLGIRTLDRSFAAAAAEHRAAIARVETPELVAVG